MWRDRCLNRTRLHSAICSITKAQGEVRSQKPQVGVYHVSADHYCLFIIKPGDCTKPPHSQRGRNQLQAKFRASQFGNCARLTGGWGFLPSFQICTVLLKIRMYRLVHQQKKRSFAAAHLVIEMFWCLQRERKLKFSFQHPEGVCFVCRLKFRFLTGGCGFMKMLDALFIWKGW